MKSQQHAAQLVEMNQAVCILWRQGYSLQGLGASVMVDVPVVRAVDPYIDACECTPVAICSYADAQRFVD